MLEIFNFFFFFSVMVTINLYCQKVGEGISFRSSYSEQLKIKLKMKMMMDQLWIRFICPYPYIKKEILKELAILLQDLFLILHDFFNLWHVYLFSALNFFSGALESKMEGKQLKRSSYFLNACTIIAFKILFSRLTFRKIINSSAWSKHKLASAFNGVSGWGGNINED